MGDEFVVDTNILVYAFDASEPAKRAKCREIVEGVFRGDRKAVITNQIIAEFYYVVTEKIENPVPKGEALLVISAILNSGNWIKADYDTETVKNATKISMQFGLSFWDSLICQTMLENGVYRIYTEDVAGFSKLRTIKVVNPVQL